MRNEIFEPNQTVTEKVFSTMNITPISIHSALLINPCQPAHKSIIGVYQDWNVQLDNGKITIIRMRVDR